MIRASALWVGVALGALACGPPPEPPIVAEKPPPPSPEDRARFAEATVRCQTEDDCDDLHGFYHHGIGPEHDEERALAAALKSCLGGHPDHCSRAVFMRPRFAAPGTHLMTAAKCAGADRDPFVCYELDQLEADEDRASPPVKAACASLQKAGDAAAPGVLGPLVDRCPGLATPKQRERAKLFRSEEEIAKAYATAGSASPRQLRRIYERLAPLQDPRADEVLAIGIRRFAQPADDAFTKKRADVLASPAVQPKLTLCALDGSTAFLSPVAANGSAAADILLRFVVPALFPPAWPFLFPDAPPTLEERKAQDDAARERAAAVDREVKAATGATTIAIIQTCDDVRWFAEKSAERAPPPG